MGATPFWWNPVAPGCQEIALDATEQQKQVNPAFTLTYGRFWILLDERMVALPGLEPGLSALRGRRVNQLHHNAIVVHSYIAPSSRNPTWHILHAQEDDFSSAGSTIPAAAAPLNRSQARLV